MIRSFLGSPLRASAVVVALSAAPLRLVDDEAVERVGEIENDEVDEASGLARSSYPGVFWVHNDSGDDARLFAIDVTGKDVIPPYLASKAERKGWDGVPILDASNVDWEDLTVADGTIYIAETGNNGNARRDLGVYVVNEPNPRAVEKVRALTFLPIRFPDQEAYPGDAWEFDCEGLFVADGKLHFLTKHRRAGRIDEFASGTKLYRLDTRYTDRENVLTLVGARDDLSVVTSADTSPDGARVAVLTYTHVWVFERPDDLEVDGNWLRGKASAVELPVAKTRTIEGVTWIDEATLLLVNEQSDLYRVEVSALEVVD